MRIADLDIETKKVIFWAHAVHRRATAENLKSLGEALEKYDHKHRMEREANLMRALSKIIGEPE